MEGTEDISELRQRRLEEMQQRQDQERKTREMLTNLRRGILPFIDDGASARLDRVRMVDPMKAAKAESYIAQLLQSGRASQAKKITEQELLAILKKIEPEKRETRILRR